MMALKSLIFFSLCCYRIVFAMEVQLANSYQQQSVANYLVSEKLDGVRAIWRNKQLVTRNGKQINAPSWFTEHWPDTWLDGELWSKHNDFEFIASTVLDHKANQEAWQNIKFFVFDMPDTSNPFIKRYQNYRSIISESKSAYLVAIEQFQFSTDDQLAQFYQTRLDEGAEGVMLHAKNALFSVGRSANLLKYKPHQDAEGVVVGYSAGKGKYKGLVGALIIELENGDKLKLGSGLSDQLRSTPPAIGSKVTYRYNGFTKYGKPRFARFLRQRKEE
ncbi:DNA ligase [Pseudoalteromonas sp. G4]|uniref:DNA ligase n=1 Tax=Pseudoalteromonas sp. G4 TaxID=2992761 RepID=UPI00237E68E1|nr:DNA ligase [Pseudoalteromonas sp. G4]